MYLSIAIALTCIFISALTLKILPWRRNFHLAQATGFPAFLSPVHINDLWWLVLQSLVAPYIELLPESWTHPWLPLLQIWKLWDVGHKPFEKVGSDNVMFATPSATMFYTCDPVVVKQLYSSPKVQAAIENLQFLNIWGPNISTVEGDEWKYHRKIITSALNPSMNEMVWRETIQEAEGLIAHWFRGNNPGYIANVKSSTSCLVLHVLSSVFFDRKLDWKEEEKVDETDFETALFTVIERAGLIFMVPRKILKLPIKGLRKA